MPILPGLNYNSKLSVDDLEYFQQSNEYEILERLKIVYGTGVMAPRYGILDSTNPKNLISTETSRPLIVYQSPNNTLRVNVNSGVAISTNGSIIKNNTLQEDVQLARTASGDIIVVFLENEIISADPTRITRYNVSQQVRLAQNTSVLRSALLSDFTNPILFTPLRRDNIVVLSVVKVVDTTSGLQLQFDYSDTIYSFNRPWFSPVDIEHRSSIGSGTPNSRNIHGLSFNDLVSGNLTLYDQILQYGAIIARDDDIKGSFGTLCRETITPSRILIDGGGSITSRSRFGGIGAKYIVLGLYPVSFKTLYLASHKGFPFAWDWIPGTRILVLPGQETFTSNAIAEYLEVKSLEPPASLFSNKIEFLQPNTANELVVAGGLAHSTLADPTINFEGSGPVPRNYTLFATGSGTIVRTPDIARPVIKLDDVGTSINSITYSMIGPSKLSIGLADAVAGPALSVVVRLYGKDPNGTTISEDITFGSSWTAVTLPSVEVPTQFIKTTQTFGQITDFQVMARANDGPNSRIVIFAEYETFLAKAFNKMAIVATCLWDGLAVGNLEDKRKIIGAMPEYTHKYFGAAEMFNHGGTTPTLLLSEDLKFPKYRDPAIGTNTATQASFSLIVNDYTLFQAGDTITFPTLPTPKVITAITAGVPNRILGQFLASTSDQATRDDMVLTINDITFNSGVTATADALITNRINCVMNILGARGNGTVALSLLNAGALSKTSDAQGGIDAFGENKTLKQYDFVSSIIPSTSTYDVSIVNDRYQSVAIPVSNKPTIIVHVHGSRAGSPYPLQVRIRMANTTSTVWLPWELMTQDGNRFTITKLFNMSKIQLQVFGKFDGLSVYESL